MFKKTKAQQEATKLLSSPAKHILLFGGSRSGKTFILVRAIVIRALKVPNTKHAIFRFRFNHAKQSIFNETLPKVLEVCYPTLPVTFNQVDCTVTFHNGSTIYVGGLDDKARAEKILGLEFSTIYFNEATQIPYESMLMAQTRLAEKSDLKNKFYTDCNPSVKSHWLYKYFVKKVDPITGQPHTHPENYVSMRLNPEDNRENISDDYIEDVLGSLSERQRQRFLHGEWQADNPFALWNLDTISKSRVSHTKGVNLSRIVVGVDPAVSYSTGSDLTGIVVAGISDSGQYYILGDYSMAGSPLQWAGRVVRAYHEHSADRIIGEVNNGGDLIETVLRQIDSKVSYRKVTATRGKAVRAEPIAALYEQGKVHHVGSMPDLEDQMCEWVPNDPGQKSPDRMDALVWALTDLVDNNGGPNRFGIMPASRS